ncbi:MAG TPA: amidase family protein, partial [Candidatus Binatia bacterium]|nr:amidase family protein [Candidatus Binatia bacterium]
AAYCGIVGFKPTHGLISRHGALMLSRTLDHVGLFANSIDDIALLAEQLVGYDEHDADTEPRARIPFVDVTAEDPPLPPVFAFIKTPVWGRADEETREGFAEIIEDLGVQVEEVELFPSAQDGWQWHQTIMSAEMAHNLDREWTHGRDLLSEQLVGQIGRGHETRAPDYLRALSRISLITQSFLELFEQRYDAILTPAAPGAAPKGIASTGDPSFCTLWTLCGMPAISLPLLQSFDGLPIGVQLVGPRYGDARLLRTARWLAAKMAS